MSDPFRYACALITAASSGLGEEFALQFAPRVKHLILVARRESLLDAVATRISTKYPELTVSVIAADLAKSGERERLIQTLAQRGLAPDVLVNNAGLGDYGEFRSAEWPKLETMLRVNVEALTHLTHALVGGMIRSGRGAVIQVSSLASTLPIPDFAVYAATKAYVSSFSEALRIELKQHGIAVLAVCPGPVHTGFGAVAQRGEGERKVPGREAFYVPKEQVVEEALRALESKRARVYPALKTRLAALAISAVPMCLLRQVMSCRPRR